MTILATFARLIGIPERLAEDALHSERAARHTLSRRGMMGALAAMAAGSVVSLPALPAARVLVHWSAAQLNIGGAIYVLDFVTIHEGDRLAIDIGSPALVVNGEVRVEGRLLSRQPVIRVADSGRGGVG